MTGQGNSDRMKSWIILWASPADDIGSESSRFKGALQQGLQRPQNYRKFAKFPLTRWGSLLVYESREEAGPVPSGESVFFSGPASQFSAVDDC